MDSVRYNSTHTAGSIARCMRFREPGGGSVVRFSSDRLTQKQWKERCGKVMTYQLGSPMGWNEFKQMPSDLQKQYIEGLRSRFGVNAASLSEMFGVTALTVRRHIAANDLGVVFPVGKSMSKDQREQWDAFISNGGDGAKRGESVPVPPEPASEQEPAEERGGMKMSDVRLCFSGAIDVSGIANSLRLILGDHPYGHVEIFCELQ